MSIYRFPLALAGAFVPEEMAQLKGYAGADISLSGSTSAPVIDGSVTTDSVNVFIPMTSMNLRFENKPITVKNNKLMFDKYSIFSRGKNPYIIDGSVDFANMENMYMDLKPITYQWKNDIGRSHCGLIAQWTKNAMDKHGIDEREFGAYEHDRKEDTYGITYTELPSLNMHMIQKTIKRVNTHDKEIAELKSEIARLQSKLDAYVNGTLEIKRA